MAVSSLSAYLFVITLLQVSSNNLPAVLRLECDDAGTCETRVSSAWMQNRFQSGSLVSLQENQSQSESEYDQDPEGESGGADPYVSFRTLFEDGLQQKLQTSNISWYEDVALANLSSEYVSKADWLNYLEQNLQAIGQTIPGPYAVYAGDSTGVLMKTHTDGYDMNQADEVASASKWHAGITILALIEDGLIDFYAPASKYLKFWTTDASDQRSKVLVKHLLQFSSNFGGSAKKFWHDCIGEESYTYQTCAEHLYKTTYLGGEPGAVFFYDHTHTEILVAIAEEVTGKPWLDIYKEKVADKIGMVIKPDGSNGWGYSHTDVSKKLHISANDYAKFMTSLFKTVNGKGPLLNETTVKLFQDPGVLICQSPTGLQPNGVYCGGWFGDKITYASTYFWGVDSKKRVYDASPGVWGFWPEMMLPSHQYPNTSLPKLDEFGGFWWQLAIQLPQGRDFFVSVQFYKVAEAIRDFLIPFFGGYKKEWGMATGKLPQHDCSWPKFCACGVSYTYPKHPAEKKMCDAGIRDSCASKDLYNPVCDVASTETQLYSSSRLRRKWLKLGIQYACSLDACPWASKQIATAGCPQFIDLAPEKCLDRAQTAGIRCCSPDGSWVPNAHSQGRPFGCQATATYVDAARKCASYGFRLCKKSELQKTCWMSGCDSMDKQPVWVSDGCT